ncbi:MAG: type II toxin-antitoxin system VapC family toxin [Fimbriimonadaceae bacterium]|nr:type II toxin-antitoxin system VapC family toxin [Fimbriimonadaceae bacterium]
MDRYLLDSSCLVRLAGGHHMSERVRRALDHPESRAFVSPVSVYELELKTAIGKLRMRVSVRGTVDALLAEGAEILDFDRESAHRLATLPLLHRDPFDRMLICQAIEHGCILVTDAAEVLRYPIRTLWA